MDSKKFSHISIQDTEAVKLYLKSLIEALEKKQITLSSGKEKMEMAVGDLCRVSIQAKKKGLENKLSIKLNWRENGKPMELSEDDVEIL